MTYSRGEWVISVEQINGCGKNPSLWIGKRNDHENYLTKVANFSNPDRADDFCEYLDHFLAPFIDRSETRMSNFCVECVICGTPVPLTEREEAYITNAKHANLVKVCNDCKNAVKYVKKHFKYTIMKEEEE